MPPLTLRGRVEAGEGIARQLGCPTANIAIEHGVIIPALGVYVGETRLDGKIFPSLVCINDGRTGVNLKMEVHLIDQTMDLSNRLLTVVLFEKMRDLVPFPGHDAMAEMIRDDLAQAKEWFAKK